MSEREQEQRIERLEAENRALRRVNAKLLREHLGSSNTAAAIGAERPLRRRGLAGRLRAPLARARLAARRVALRLLR